MIEIEDVLKNDFTKDLCIFDSIHDFWKERARKKKSSEEDDEDEVDETSLEKTKTKLLSNIGEALNTQVQNVNSLLQQLTNNYVNSSTSKYEQTVRAYCETNPFMEKVGEYLTYDDIIQKKGNWDGLIRGSSNMISVEPGKKYNSFNAVMADKKQNVVAEFILKYMFPQSGGSSNTYITFDAKTGIMREIFRDIEQVFHLITPANIADSATTSINRLHNGRNVFYFPNEKVHTFHSNYFTGDNTVIELVNTGFSDKNNYGFQLKITPKGGNPLVFPFSANQNSGPSVNYLVDLLLGKQTQSKNMVNLDKLKNHTNLIDNGILFDLKRGGDYEQVNSAKIVKGELGNVILSTIDILCSVYARCIHQPVIRHLNDNLEIYRFSDEALKDKEMGELIQLKFKTLKLIQNLTLIKNVVENKLVNELYDFQQKCVEFIQNGHFYFLVNVKHLESGKKVEQSVPEKIVEELVKHRLTDILSMFKEVGEDTEKLKSQLEKVQIEPILGEINVLTSLIETYGSKIEKIPLQQFIQTYNVNSIIQKYEITTATSGTKRGEFQLIDQINQFIQKISTVFTLTNTESKILSSGKSPLGLEGVELAKSVRGGGGGGSILCFTHIQEISSIQWVGKKYFELADALFKLERILTRPRHPSFYSVLKDAGYFNCVNSIYSQYYHSSSGEKAYNLLSPPKTEDKDIDKWFGELLSNASVELKKNVKQTLKNKTLAKPETVKPLKPSQSSFITTKKIPTTTTKGKTRVSVSKAPRRKRGGGDGDGDDDEVNVDVGVYQYYDLNDLLADISSQSASFIESIMTKYMEKQRGTSVSTKPSDPHTEGGTIQYTKQTRKRGRSRLEASIERTPKRTKYIKANSRTKSRTMKQRKTPTLKNEIYPPEQMNTQQKMVSEFIVYLKENHLNEISELMEKLSFQLEMGIVSLHNNTKGLYTYKPTMVELYLLCVLSMNKGAFQDNLFLKKEQNKDIFREVSVSRLENRLNDVGTKYAFASEKIPPEIINILVLTLVDNLLQPNKTGYFSEFIDNLVVSLRRKQINGRSFETKQSWEKVMDIFYILIHCVSNNTFVPPREVINLMNGGNGCGNS